MIEFIVEHGHALTWWGRHKMDAILQTIVSNAFSCDRRHFNFYRGLTELCFLGSNWQKATFDQVVMRRRRGDNITATSQWARWHLKSPASRCFLNRLFRRTSKKTSKLRVTGLCARNSPVTGEFAAQKASNTGNVSIWWRHPESLSETMMVIIAKHRCVTGASMAKIITSIYVVAQEDVHRDNEM